MSWSWLRGYNDQICACIYDDCHYCLPVSRGLLLPGKNHNLSVLIHNSCEYHVTRSFTQNGSFSGYYLCCVFLWFFEADDHVHQFEAVALTIRWQMDLKFKCLRVFQLIWAWLLCCSLWEFLLLSTSSSIEFLFFLFIKWNGSFTSPLRKFTFYFAEENLFTNNFFYMSQPS